jgi:hypothetical protein
MKKIVCVIDNHIQLEYGKTYEVVSEKDGKYKLLREYFESDIAGIYWWDETFFVSLEEFRNEKIDRIVE